MDRLGAVIKEARLQRDLKQNALAARLGITSRHLMSIEAGRHKPSYDLLFRLIRELSVSADRIFYPEVTVDRQRFEQAVAMLRQCDDRQLTIITATLFALLKE